MFPWWAYLAGIICVASPPPAEPASVVAARAGAACERGCIVADDGWVYEVTRDDLVWTARAANCEIASVIGTDDAPAALWSLAQNFVRRHRVGIRESFGSFVQSYSACTSKRWAEGGSRYSPRITPLATVNRRLRWNAIPQRVRNYVRAFFRGEVPNRWPGYVYVLTAGWERHADPRMVGPFYVARPGPGSRNAYYADPSTVGWGPWTVRITGGAP